MKSKKVDLADVVAYLRGRQESNRLALTQGEETYVLRARHRHDVYKDLADDIESGMVTF